MHKYNNQDHSMLAAMVAVDNIVGNIPDKQNIWAVNTEQEYIEEKPAPVSPSYESPTPQPVSAGSNEPLRCKGAAGHL